ncbi:MAG: hypothetical protein HC882_06920 [Acidobacteria bacterium]|nr:hypothetical protein [Acidobacteriota bacterium]
MRLSIVHDDVLHSGRPDDADVFEQVALFRDHALDDSVVDVLPLGTDLSSLVQRLREDPPDVIANLVETLGGDARLSHVVPSILEAFDVRSRDVRAAACSKRGTS